MAACRVWPVRSGLLQYRSILVTSHFVPGRLLSSSTLSSSRPRTRSHSSSTSSITSVIQERMDSGDVRYDPEQLELAQTLDVLRQKLIHSDRSIIPTSELSVNLFSDAKPKRLLEQAALKARRMVFQMRHYQPLATTRNPKGLYIHGSVGVGKSFLMNLFVDAMEESNTVPNRKIRRVHFHEFMLDVHDRIHRSKLRNPRHDPLPPLALSIAQESRLLCLDEFQVTDIADAAILKRLLEMLWSSHIGMVLVTTSNRAPDALYEGGLNRSMFLPFIATLKSHMDVLEMSGRRDYRREKTSGIVDDEDLSSYYWPADDPSTRQALDRIFAKGGTEDDDDQLGTNYRLPVRMGRYVHVPRSNNHCAWFEFDDLCNRPLGAADYLSICERYEILIVDHVPQLDGSRFNEARRFVTLIDAVYESKTRLVLASNQVPLNELFVDFDATVESNDGDEEIAVDDGSIVVAPMQTAQEIFVKGEGGSSSSASTTMIRNGDGGTVEWSATGRIGVSLAQLSAVKDVSFSFQRAESRLAEINGGSWGR